MALEAMDKEIDIVEFIKSSRFVKMSLKKLLSERVRMELKQRSRYQFIDPDKEEKLLKANTL